MGCVAFVMGVATLVAGAGKGPPAVPASRAKPPAELGLQWVFSARARVEFSKSEVTVAQYRACVQAGHCSMEKGMTEDAPCNLGHADRGRHPVNCVNWKQASDFCSWVGGRLPTDWQWEAEAIAHDNRKNPWGGEAVSCERAVMNQGGLGCGRGSTWPVCSKPAGNSVSGLCDMSGNVWEWTSSRQIEGTGTPIWNKEGQKHPTFDRRAVRGGSWASEDSLELSSSGRSGYKESTRYFLIGFRCVRSP